MILSSFSEFKFYQSFRLPVEEADDLRFLVQMVDTKEGVEKEKYISDAKLKDISLTGLGLLTNDRISIGAEVRISLQFRKHHLDLNGTVVRAFSEGLDKDGIIYGVEIEDDKHINTFLKQFVTSFSGERLKECLIQSALKENYTKVSDSFEMFSLLLALFKDINTYGDKEGFIESMLQEVVRVLNAQRASIFLINPHSNELEAIAAVGINQKQREMLKFDYRLGIAGAVFTTGGALNIDCTSEKVRFNEKFDQWLKFETKSIICYPIHNGDDKVIGVLEVLNKRNQDRFTVDDEKTMKVLTLIFSSVFHKYNPISESSIIRRFSNPFDRKQAIIGKTPHVQSLRETILKLKDVDSYFLIQGEVGVGKTLFANIVHNEGRRGLHPFKLVECGTIDPIRLEKELWGNDNECALLVGQGGTVVYKNIERLTPVQQETLFEILTKRQVPSNAQISIDVRVVATTTANLGQMVDAGQFNRGLFETIAKAFVHVEPVRRRIDDLDELVAYFFKQECKDQGFLLKSFSQKVTQKLKDYHWPGNITELRRLVSRAVLYNPKAHIITELEKEDSASPLFDLTAKIGMFGNVPFVHDYHITLKDRVALMEREMIMAEIKRLGGNKTKAAEAMGISREALRKKMLISDEILGGLDRQKESANAAVENTDNVIKLPVAVENKDKDKKAA
ncbi:MAG: sigma 54-interacting transcriptional regulator [Pseudomonadota bacterium]